MNKWDYLVGDAREVLKTLKPESIQCVVTSPPYWGLRDYGIEPTIWGGELDCAHEFFDVEVHKEMRRGISLKDSKVSTRGGGKKIAEVQNQDHVHGFCQLCGAWRGCLGLEPTPELYVEHLVDIFQEVKRVLRKDGTLWLNLGDSYYGGKGKSGQAWSTEHQNRSTLQKSQHQICVKGETRPNDLPHDTLKPKDLVGIPWRVAFALQTEGWFLRSDIIWSKSNPMPESVTDRPTKAHEYLFLLSKAKSYYYDADAIRDSIKLESKMRAMRGNAPNNKYAVGSEKPPGVHANTMSQPREYKGYDDMDGAIERGETPLNPAGRNKRSVWEIPTQPYPEAHFAVFPEALVEPCIKAGTSPKACGKCGRPYERELEKQHECGHGETSSDYAEGTNAKSLAKARQHYREQGFETPPAPKTIGWKPTCKHKDNSGVQIVLDPFAGSGTTIAVARRLERSAIGIDINPEYEKLAKDRARLRQPNILSGHEVYQKKILEEE